MNLATDETAIALDDEFIADETVSLEAEKSSCPRLAWNRGRDDAAILVAHGPLYVHEKVNPLEFVKSLMNAPENEAQSDMFSTFNGLREGAAFEPYSDSGNRTNRLIRAASQRVTASLLEREGCVAKWAWCTGPALQHQLQVEHAGVGGRTGRKRRTGFFPRRPGQIQAFRDSYRNGVHSCLDQFRTQLTLIRALLADSGSVFLQI